MYMHYAEETVAFCEIGGFSCHTVNKSVFSNFDGVVNHFLGTNFNLFIPNALISIFVFLFIFLGGLFVYNKKRFFGLSKKNTLRVIELLLIVGLVYGILLIYIQAYVLFTWCMFCLVLDGLIVLCLIVMLLIGGDS